MNSHTNEPTLASTWYAVSKKPLSDHFLEWPADLFAVINVILERSEVYRFALSPTVGLEWPPSRFTSWSEAVADTARQWSLWVEDRRRPIPHHLAEEWSVLREHAQVPLEHLALGHDARVCQALLTLHAIADEACARLGIALETSDGEGCVYRAWGRELLARTGSLARLESHCLRVLPKVGTPKNGASFRSLSRYACVQGPGVEVRWHKVPIRRRGTDPQARHANLLLLPWPLRVRESDFRPLQGSVHRVTKEPFGFFEFVPAERLDLDLVDRMIATAGERLCAVFELYQQIAPQSRFTMDQFIRLAIALTQGGYLEMGHCTSCHGALLVERLVPSRRICLVCQQDALTASRVGSPDTRTQPEVEPAPCGTADGPETYQQPLF